MRLRKNIICARAIHQEANHAFLRMLAGRSDGSAKPYARAKRGIQAHQGLSNLDEHAFTMRKSKGEIVQALWGARNKGLPKVETVPALPGRHGQPARRPYARKKKQQWQLRTGKLQMGNLERAGSQSPLMAAQWSAFALSARTNSHGASAVTNPGAQLTLNIMPTAPASVRIMPKTSALKLSKKMVPCGEYGVAADFTGGGGGSETSHRHSESGNAKLCNSPEAARSRSEKGTGSK